MQLIEWASRWESIDGWIRIGLTDRVEEGTFVWESGSELSADISAHMDIRWNPDDYDYQMDCAIIKPDGKIQDRRCEWPKAFVCQKL